MRLLRLGNAFGAVRAGVMILGVLAVGLAQPAAAGKRADGAKIGRAPDFEWSGKVARGGSVEIRGVNGGIVAEPTTGDQVEVTAIKTANRSDPDEVKIALSTRPDGITICTVYTDRSGNEPTDCSSESSWHSHTHNNDVSVEYHVKLPAGVRFVARTVNGAIEARRLGAAIKAETVNGSVNVSTSDAAEAETVNGSIRAEIGSSRWSDPIELKTVNGSIRVLLPPDVGAEVRAATMNGDIETDFPLTVRGRIGGRHLSGTLGKGGGSLRLENVNGGISIIASK